MATNTQSVNTVDLARAAFSLDLKSRLIAAHHPDTPPAARAHLADDPHRSVRLSVALNEEASSYNLARVIDRESDWLPRLRWLLAPNGLQATVFAVVAGHPNASESTLRAILRLAPASGAAERASERLNRTKAHTGAQRTVRPHTS